MRESKAFGEGGIFGVPRACLGQIESELRGKLHFHEIIYLAGLRSSCEEFELKCR